MVVNRQQRPGRDTEHRVLEGCCVCGRELNDMEAMIIVDYGPVDFLDGPGVLRDLEIRCETCLALLPECPVCEGSMRECRTCGARYCRRHAVVFTDRDPTTTLAATSLCGTCLTIQAETGLAFGERRPDDG
ncbi:MAG: hypothetical protein F4X52_01075 [Acidimicrobiaceae bacterium]|nr:hypothetical protein [Acidimicrobiaceae bacterium]MYC41126.1 hypothetical protein [Acidimicrobiaceae bacterium]MYH87694.1 hypothetical protein [Acidimicrobiaceae bacterium]